MVKPDIKDLGHGPESRASIRVQSPLGAAWHETQHLHIGRQAGYLPNNVA